MDPGGRVLLLPMLRHLAFIVVNAYSYRSTPNNTSLLHDVLDYFCIQEYPVHTAHLHCRIRLRKCPRQCLNAIRHPLELILLLARNLIHHIRRRIIITVAPLDFHGIEIDLDICAIEILAGTRWEATESRDKGEELLDVVTG